VKSAPDAQRRLLDLQAIDTALGQLAHRRRALPELPELDRLARELSALTDGRVRAEVGVDDIDRDIARLEKDIDQVRARADRDRARLDAGTGPAKELEALQHELGTLGRRQTELEDAELELMEQREQAQAGLDAIAERVAAAQQKRAELEARRDASLAEIERDEQSRTAARAPLVSELPADLLAMYERIREASGIGAALLRAGRCEGCRLELSGSERSRVKSAAPDEVVRCEECGRILVRTPESGL
jgi:predicted  nucleic acid-binding Zn-ribbon protein